MKNSRVSMLLLLGAILLQWTCMRNVPALRYELPFMTGLISGDSIFGSVLITMYSIIPLPFFLMYVSGGITDLTEGYGKLQVIRQYGKGRLILKLMLKNLLITAGITGFMWIVFTVLREDNWNALGRASMAKGVLLYILTLNALTLLQYVFELYMQMQHANVLTILISVLSIFMSELAGGKYRAMSWLLFPNLAFAQRNGVLESSINTSFACSLCWITLVNLLFGAVVLIKYRKKDIM